MVAIGSGKVNGNSVIFKSCGKVRDIFIQSNFRLENRPLSNYASVPAISNLKARLRALFSYICCIFSHEVRLNSGCLRKLKRNSKVAFCYLFEVKFNIYVTTLSGKHFFCHFGASVN